MKLKGLLMVPQPHKDSDGLLLHFSVRRYQPQEPSRCTKSFIVA